MAGVWSSGSAKISGVTDAAGNTYTKVTSIVASEATRAQRLDGTDHGGRRNAPVITVTAAGGADIGAAAMQYAGLSSAAGTGFGRRA